MKSAQINPYLTFNGNCREAMDFYLDCFGGELQMQTVAESPMADQWPTAVQKNILHASLVKEGLTLLASDMAAHKLKHGNTISLALACASEEEIKVFFKKLSQGGKVTHDLHKFFGGA